MNFINQNYFVACMNCIEGMKKHIPDNSVNLVFTDPPYGIDGATLDKHYARYDSYTIPGYVDIDRDKYAQFSKDWINEVERCLKPGGSVYIVSGYTCLRDILNALSDTNLIPVNHLIAKYSFGVSTKRKWISSHYHILYYCKEPESKKCFNLNCRYTDIGDSYHDRLSVQDLNRTYKKKQKKNKNELPQDFVEKFILYSSNRGDVILDPFLGGFSTAFTSLRLGRKVIGFEINPEAYNYFEPMLKSVSVLPTDPPATEPSAEVMEQRRKKREGYRRQRERVKKITSSTATISSQPLVVEKDKAPRQSS